MDAEYQDFPRRGIGGYFSFRGFAGRQQFWAVMIIVLIVGAALQSLLINMLGQGINVDAIIRLAIFGTFVVSVWIPLATSFRRARDAGISPWWAILMLVPVVSLIMLLVLGFLRSRPR